jgi:hypothetical protein
VINGRVGTQTSAAGRMHLSVAGAVATTGTISCLWLLLAVMLSLEVLCWLLHVAWPAAGQSNSTAMYVM